MIHKFNEKSASSPWISVPGRSGVVLERPPLRQLISIERFAECCFELFCYREQRDAGESVLRKGAYIAELVRVTPDCGLQAEFSQLLQRVRVQKIVNDFGLQLA